MNQNADFNNPPALHLKTISAGFYIDNGKHLLMLIILTKVGHISYGIIIRIALVFDEGFDYSLCFLLLAGKSIPNSRAVSMKILIVEDDRATMFALKKNLENSGYSISEATTGPQGVEVGSSNDFDLILLDIVLPEMNGIEVCKALRDKGVQSPIIMLTAIQSKETMIEGLDAGADDYLTKPVDQMELEARIRSILRRFEKTGAGNVQRFADVEIDHNTKSVKRGGTNITLTVTEFKLLSLFIEKPNKVFSRSELLESVWDIDFYLGTNVVDVYINYLRKKIDKPFDTKLIHTSFGQGYVMKLEA